MQLAQAARVVRVLTSAENLIVDIHGSISEKAESTAGLDGPKVDPVDDRYIDSINGVAETVLDSRGPSNANIKCKEAFGSTAVKVDDDDGEPTALLVRARSMFVRKWTAKLLALSIDRKKRAVIDSTIKVLRNK